MADDTTKKLDDLHSLIERSIILDRCINRYKKALDAISNCSDVEEILNVLVARDVIHVALSDAPSISSESVKTLIQLDQRLKEQTERIARDDQLAEWRKSVNPPSDRWWWYLSINEALKCAVKRYADSLKEYETEDDPWWKELWNWITSGGRSQEADADRAIKVLLAREAVEKALKDDVSISDDLTRTIIGLDIRLKNHGKEIARQNQLARWKNSFKHFSDQWWWNLKPTAIGSPEEPQSGGESILNALGIVFLVAAASFTVSSAKAFKDAGDIKGSGWVGVEGLFVTGLQAVLLGVAAKGTLTTEGRKTIEKMLISIDVPPKQQVLVVCSCSMALFLFTWSIKASLPLWGFYLYSSASNNEQAGDWENVESDYQKAMVFNKNSEFGSVVNVSLGKFREDQGELQEAKDNYGQALKLVRNNPDALNHEARVILEARVIRGKESNKDKDPDSAVFDGVEQKLENAESLLTLSENPRSSKNKTNEDNNFDVSKYLLKESYAWSQSEIYITRGILSWMKKDNTIALDNFNKASGTFDNVNGEKTKKTGEERERRKRVFFNSSIADEMISSEKDKNEKLGKEIKCYVAIAKKLDKESKENCKNVKSLRHFRDLLNELKLLKSDSL